MGVRFKPLGVGGSLVEVFVGCLILWSLVFDRSDDATAMTVATAALGSLVIVAGSAGLVAAVSSVRGRLLLGLSGALALVLVGWAAGAADISGVEPAPTGAFIDCGPAVFGRWSPMAHPACAADLSHPAGWCWALIGAGVALTLVTAALLVRLRQSEPAESRRPTN